MADNPDKASLANFRLCVDKALELLALLDQQFQLDVQDIRERPEVIGIAFSTQKLFEYVYLELIRKRFNLEREKKHLAPIPELHLSSSYVRSRRPLGDY